MSNNKLWMTAIVRDLKEDIIRLNCKLKLSNFIPPPLEEIIKEKVPNENYILGVTYRRGDSQICMSGHVKIGESYQDGCVREMSEELFLEPKEDFLFEKVKSTKTNHFYVFNIRETKIKPRIVSDNVEDTRERVIICVHGSEYDIMRYMKRLRAQEYTNDGIISIWAAQKKNILGAIYGVRGNQRGLNHIY
jgi:hypothetical protein